MSKAVWDEWKDEGRPSEDPPFEGMCSACKDVKRIKFVVAIYMYGRVEKRKGIVWDSKKEKLSFSN